MLPAKSSHYQQFPKQVDCDPSRLRTVGSTAPHLIPLPGNTEDADPGCVNDPVVASAAISFDVSDSQAKRDLVSMVSHDLRSPLTALRVSVGMFLGGAFGEMSPDAVKRLEAMGASVDLLIRMINDLLDVEKLEAGQLRFYIKQSETRQLVDSAIQAVTGIAEAKNIEFKIVGRNHQVEVDADRVVQVLINLLSNAIKFSPANSVVEIHTVSRNGGVEFRVIDHGKGISPSHLRHVFQPFEQLDSQSDLERMGSGLGLTIAKKIIEAHGGLIGVDSEVGRGSQFWFRFKAGR